MKWYFISTFRFIYIYLLHFVFLLLFLFFLLFGFLRPCYLFGWMLIFFLLVISFHCSSIYMRFPFSIYLFFAQRFITGLCLIQNSFGCVFSVCCCCFVSLHFFCIIFAISPDICTPSWISFSMTKNVFRYAITVIIFPFFCILFGLVRVCVLLFIYNFLVMIKLFNM